MQEENAVSQTESQTERQHPWFMWPFVAVWRLVGWILGLTGRLLAIVLGIVMIIVGVPLSMSVIGAIIGVPLIILGVLLLLRGFF
jgi:hypothetical protein